MWKIEKMVLFRQFISNCSLMDMELKGCRFTWVSNPRDGLVTKEKIGRVLVNCDWRLMLPNATVVALPMVNSGHSPIILHPSPLNMSEEV